MISRLLPLAILSVAIGACPRARAENRLPAQTPGDTAWHPGVPLELYVAPGRATTIVLRTAQKVASISLASPIIVYKYDKALNQIEITPTVRTGGVETNLNLRLGSDIYVLLVKVVDDVRAQTTRSFVPAGEAAADEDSDLAQAPPLRPAEIDIVTAARVLNQAETDPVFRQARPDLRIEPIGRLYEWNDCVVELVDAGQFAARDLLVFRVQWVNRTADALYLDPAQYRLSAAGRAVPIAARYKPGLGAVVYPGALETVYLGVQGYQLSRHNDWRLDLPLDGATVGRLLSR
jgi:hypothetical protein